ncbi:MAG: FtsW/RodA/SpoVE family cell cycle protein [Bacteroidia bacterium]|nr:FtsW/RodA/SpoVE family cell cycle protein [Bacteroidia bacterium]
MNFLESIKGDRIIWIVVVILSLFSLLVVYSSSIGLAYRYKDGHTEYFLFKHTLLTLSGLFVIYYIHNIKITTKELSIIGLVGFPISIILLVFTLVMGVKSGEASRWLEVPGLGITFQSSDVAKITLIIFIARSLAIHKDKLKEFKDVVYKIIFPTALICFLILISNFSTAFLLALTIFYMLFISNVSFKILFKLIGILMLLAVIFISTICFFPNILPRGKTWKSRIENYIKGDNKSNYQVEQAKIAISNGVFIGKGPGNSAQRAFLPQASSDFIYAIIIEEYGTLIGIFILMSFLVIFFRTIRIVQKSKSLFYSYVVAGLSFNMILQAIVNMAVAVNLLPVTGQPLPFISMGGTSLIFSSINIGIILNISRQVYEQERTLTNEDATQNKNIKDIHQAETKLQA